MDTKLKKSHKRTNLIIALIVLLPALLLVCLYPKMEKAMLEKKEQWHTEWEEYKAESENEETSTEVPKKTQADSPAYFLEDNFVNYVVETSYYQYAMLLQDALGEAVFTDVLEQYGWINDYYEVVESTPYYAEYWHQGRNSKTEDNEGEIFSISDNLSLSDEEVQKLFDSESLGEDREVELAAEGMLGYLTIEYDAYGKLSDIRIHANDKLEYETRLYQKAKSSIEQYKINAQYYETDMENSSEAEQICPKNFRAVYLLYDTNVRFVNSYDDYYDSYYYRDDYEPYYAPYEYYFATGSYWIVLVLAVLVALAAFILPFFKKLETGWEKLFCIPTEVIAIIACCAITLAYGMCMLMSITTVDAITNTIVIEGQAIEFLGYHFSVRQCYYMLLAVNFLGWAAAFFMEYICAAQLRQFFCGPVYYIKHRFIGVAFIRWILKQCKLLFHYVTDIDINENIHKSIVKVVLANFVIVTVLCCFWFAGIFGVIVYSVLLYLLLRKYGGQVQKQYQSILKATGQMAEGDLKISLDEDLGIFAPLGEELEKVQQGFSKAVAEEAKSQNMKSELITNVSHDLKTPLTAIITYVDLLKKEDITEEERASYIQTLDLKSQRLKALIEDLFEVSKANSGNVQMNFMEVDIVKLMKEVRLELEDKIEESGLDFRWNLPEEKVILSLDGARTYRVFENLINNAIKYAMPYTRVYVDIFDKESEVQITFKNISAQELHVDTERLTERFVRGDSSRNSEGSGLGLAIARSFVELQNGTFRIEVDGDLFKAVIAFAKN